MRKLEFKNPEFVKSATNYEELPLLRDRGGQLLPEIAVIGRSNVGKSTLLNSLFKSKLLVKTSSTPGKTSTLNFFLLNKQLAFVDLPGYGYAKIEKKEEMVWKEMIENYLHEREPLKLLLFLLDIRREPSEGDQQMFNWLKAMHFSFILILTKVDKVTLSEKERQTNKILDFFQNIPFVHYSALKNQGRDQLIYLICQQLSLPCQN